MFDNFFYNILHNAIKYTPSHGEIHIQLLNRSDSCTLTIQDNGIGIPSSDLPHIFQKYYQANQSTSVSGIGLGLAIVKRIINLHNGDIEVCSKENEGTIFTITLPTK